MTNPLEKEFRYYLEHQDEIVESYNGKFVVIKDEVVLGSYDDELAAVTQTRQTHQIGTFLVQRVSAGDAAYSQTFHRVVFQ